VNLHGRLLHNLYNNALYIPTIWNLEDFLLPMLGFREVYHIELSFKKVFHSKLDIGEILPPTWSTVKAGNGMLSLKELCYPMLDLRRLLYLKCMVKGCLYMIMSMEKLGNPTFFLEGLGHQTT